VLVEDLRSVRVLIVSNMAPDPERPALGAFVRTQVAALRRIPGIEVCEHHFAPRSPLDYLRAAPAVRRATRGLRFDVVHAHFGLTAWPALAARARVRVLTMHSMDLRHPRSRRITLAALGRYDLAAAVSSDLARLVPGAGTTRRVAVLPCGVDLERFRPIDRREARRRLGLDPDEPCLLFCHDPGRADKRFDLAREAAGDVRLHVLGRVAPDEVPLWHNAANAVLVPSDFEGFGLAVPEALACDVPVLATPTGAHPAALHGVPGTLCAPFSRDRWRAALAPHLADPDPRVPGRERAALLGADVMARRVVEAWQALLRSSLASTTPAPDGVAAHA
jgi:glycosyltransferase involved in cell wall biosynthesis